MTTLAYNHVRFAKCSLVFFLFVAFVYAQVSATLSGTVTDQTGAVVSAATITAKSLDTGAEHTAVTDAGGHYLFSSLPLGNYEIRGGKPGFTEQLRTGIRLVVAEF